MNSFFKKMLATACGASLLFSLSSCTTTEDTVSDDSQKLTLEIMQDWCDEAGTGFFEGFKLRDKNMMKNYMPSSAATDFSSSFDEFFEVQNRKVWLEDFYVDYLEGAQVVSGTFLSDGQNVTMEYSIVIADYSTGNRNWLLLYDVTLEYGIDLENECADILNPEVVFDLYNDMSNDYTTHVAATLVNTTDDFDISDYYYDEDLGVYIERDSNTTNTNTTVDETTGSSSDSSTTTETTEPVATSDDIDDETETTETTLQGD